MYCIMNPQMAQMLDTEVMAEVLARSLGERAEPPDVRPARCHANRRFQIHAEPLGKGRHLGLDLHRAGEARRRVHSHVAIRAAEQHGEALHAITLGAAATLKLDDEIEGLLDLLTDGERIGDRDMAAQWRLEGAVLVAAFAVGMAQTALDAAVSFAATRESFGRPIKEFQGFLERLRGVRVLDPACGSGNFLVPVLRRKLATVEARYHKSEFEKRHHALLALMSIYGIELLADNGDSELVEDGVDLAEVAA